MRFTVHGQGGSREIEVPIEMLVIAGWSGRAEADVRAHIAELAAIGVPAPSSVPLFYRAGADRLTQAPVIQVLGGDSSGEAEAVLVGTPEGMIVAVGSDHTDRKLEAVSIAAAKQLCPKPVSRDAWWFTEVAPHWDEMVLAADRVSGETREPCQRGALAALRPPLDLVARYFDGYKAMPPGFVMFLGTIPAIGPVAPADRLAVSLSNPATGHTLAHEYRTYALPVVG